MARHIVLVGLMASGKTTVGRLLAEALGVPFSDSDTAIELERGTTVKELADEIGVDEMHELEAAHLLTALAAMIGAATILVDPIFQGLAISLLFGLASSTLLTVLVIPAIYVVLRDADAAPAGAAGSSRS